MDSHELTRRGPQLMLGAAMICVGGLLALYGVMYGPIATAADGGLGTAVVTDRARDFAMLLAVVATCFGLAAIYLYRGSIPMMLASLAVAAAGLHNIVVLVPYFRS